jgi:hypothetical protein
MDSVTDTLGRGLKDAALAEERKEYGRDYDTRFLG